jgi:hypothetical protein
MQFTPLSDENVQIYLLFYRPASDDPFQNRLVAFFDGPFCHVEMAFPERYGTEPWDTEVLGSSIYQGDTIFFKSKTYQREGYFSFAIEVSKAQCLKIKNYCRMQSENGVRFSKLAMYSAYLPIQLFSVEGTFCSKHVTMALQEGFVDDVLHLNPCLVTPSSLYRTLLLNSAKSPIVQVVPSKMMNHTTTITTTSHTHDTPVSHYNSSIPRNPSKDSVTINLVTLAKNNTLCGNMTKELLSTFRQEQKKPQEEPPHEDPSVNFLFSQSISKSFVQNHLLHPDNTSNKKLIMFYQ